jgi:hypothetical protein
VKIKHVRIPYLIKWHERAQLPFSYSLLVYVSGMTGGLEHIFKIACLIEVSES